MDKYLYILGFLMKIRIILASIMLALSLPSLAAEQRPKEQSFLGSFGKMLWNTHQQQIINYYRAKAARKVQEAKEKAYAEIGIKPNDIPAIIIDSKTESMNQPADISRVDYTIQQRIEDVCKAHNIVGVKIVSDGTVTTAIASIRRGDCNLETDGWHIQVIKKNIKIPYSSSAHVEADLLHEYGHILFNHINQRAIYRMYYTSDKTFFIRIEKNFDDLRTILARTDLSEEDRTTVIALLKDPIFRLSYFALLRGQEYQADMLAETSDVEYARQDMELFARSCAREPIPEHLGIGTLTHPHPCKRFRYAAKLYRRLKEAQE